VLDDGGHIVWKPRPEQRGDFYLGWLGQNKNVVGAGLARIEQGQLISICTHGTPYYWLQPYEALPVTVEVLRAQEVLGAETVRLDFSLAGWGMRDKTLAKTRSLSDAPISATLLETLLGQAVDIIVRNFRSEGDPTNEPQTVGLLARTASSQPVDPLERLLDLLQRSLGEPRVIPVLVELVKHDVNVMPGYRQSDFFEKLTRELDYPPPNKVARLVLSAIYHLAPLLGSRRLNSVLLLNSLRQRHPFDVTWGADFLVRSLGISPLVQLLLVALQKEKSDQIRGNVLDLLQELGYGFAVALEDEVLKGLADVQASESLGAFDQVIHSHLAYTQEYVRQRDAADQPSV
jgi:hypothetical protein